MVARFNVVGRERHTERLLERSDVVGDVRDHDGKEHVAELGFVERRRMRDFDVMAETLEQLPGGGH